MYLFVISALYFQCSAMNTLITGGCSEVVQNPSSRPNCICVGRIYFEAKVFKHNINNKRVSNLASQARFHTILNSYLFQPTHVKATQLFSRFHGNALHLQQDCLVHSGNSKNEECFPIKRKKGRAFEVWIGERVSLLLRRLWVIRHVNFGQFISLFHREFKTNGFVVFNSSFEKAL